MAYDTHVHDPRQLILAIVSFYTSPLLTRPDPLLHPLPQSLNLILPQHQVDPHVQPALGL